MPASGGLAGLVYSENNDWVEVHDFRADISDLSFNEETGFYEGEFRVFADVTINDYYQEGYYIYYRIVIENQDAGHYFPGNPFISIYHDHLTTLNQGERSIVSVEPDFLNWTPRERVGYYGTLLLRTSRYHLIRERI